MCYVAHLQCFGANFCHILEASGKKNYHKRKKFASMKDEGD